MRVRFYHSLIFRLGSAIFCLLVGFSITQQYFATSAFQSALIEAEERQALIVAREFATELSEHLIPEFQEKAVLALLLRFTSRNPAMIPFITDGDGKIVISAINGLKMQPFVLAHLRGYQAADVKLPQFTSDPRAPAKKVAFVSTEIALSNGKGFLVLVLNHSGTQASDARASLVSSTSRNFFISVLFALASSLLIAIVLLGTLTRRLRLFSHSLTKYQLGDSVSELPDGKDEVAALSRAFHKMASTIKEQVELLKQRDALRRELVAGVSHDLRTPLASIRGYLQKLIEQIEAGTLTSERLRDFLDTIQRNALRLDALVASLFELARIEALGRNIAYSAFSLSSLLDDLAKRFDPLARGRGISVTYNRPTHEVLIEADRTLLDRAISNLIDNAIRYSSEDGIVTIALVDSAEDLTISITDTGIGIPAQQHSQIFEKFYRGDTARSDGGMGLGLAITKGVVEAHGGDITLESPAAGGCCFRIRLPRSAH